MAQEGQEHKPLTTPERTQVLWGLLVGMADRAEIHAYAWAAQRIGCLPRNMGLYLGPIQQYCLDEGLPQLTVLLVDQQTGRPGVGFIAADDVAKAQREVINFQRWYLVMPPVERLQGGRPVMQVKVHRSRRTEGRGSWVGFIHTIGHTGDPYFTKVTGFELTREVAMAKVRQDIEAHRQAGTLPVNRGDNPSEA